MKSSSDPCGNPICENQGKSTCSACGSISYCSQQCQKSHWTLHKVQCKLISQNKKISTSSIPTTSMKSYEGTPAPSSSTAADMNENTSKLQAIKLELSKAYQSNDLKTIIKLGNDGILVAKLLPEPMCTIELIQLHLNLSNAFMQSNQVKEAEPHITLCVEYAEKGLILRPNHPQAAEMLSIALVSKAYWLLNSASTADAEDIATKARLLAGQIYPPKEPRNFKTLRCLGIIREKQDRIVEAEELFNQAYELVIAVNPGQNSESHMVMDDIVQMFLKRDLFESAEKYARSHYDVLIEKIPLNEPLSIVIGDAGARHASILCRMNRNVEAEVLMRQALELRVKYLGPMVPPVAMTMIALAGINEALNQPRDVIEPLLTKAYEIFYKTEGPSSFHAMKTAEHLRKLKLGQKILVDDVSTPEDVSPPSSSSSTSSSTTKNSMITNPSSNGHHMAEDDNPEAGIPAFAPNDGNGRMRQASTYFEKGLYNKAEMLLHQAYDIFVEQVGADNPVTKTAKQNLGVVRHNILTKLWKEVLQEAIDEESSSSTWKASDGDEMNSAGIAAIGEKDWYVKDTTESSGCVIS